MVYDPVTKQFVPVLSMFQTAAMMQKGMKDRVVSNRKREAILKELDFEAASDVFR